jgi:hypothetical protein
MKAMSDEHKNYDTGSWEKALSALGDKCIRELGIKPLGPGEERPDSFYLTNHFFGTSARGARAVVRKKNRQDVASS